MKTPWKSVGAVIAGIIAIVVVTSLIDGMLYARNVYPASGKLDDRLSLIASSYRLLIGIGGGWLTARLAPNRPAWHALILGAVGTLLSLVGVVATWNLGLGPHWYPISLAVLALPECWLGGWLRERQLRPAAP